MELSDDECLFCHQTSVDDRFQTNKNRLKINKKCLEEFIWNCGRFDVKWIDTGNSSKLPLCYLCHDAYQCMVEIQAQVKELELLVKKFETCLRKRIAEKDGGNKPKTSEQRKINDNEFRDSLEPGDVKHGDTFAGLRSQTKPQIDDLHTTEIKLENDPVEINLDDDSIDWNDSSNSKSGSNYGSESDESSSSYDTEFISEETSAQKPLRKKRAKPPDANKCHICDKVLTGQALTKHYSDKHPDEKLYTCKFCQRWFKERRYCIAHQQNHQEGRLFPCPVCHRLFRKSVNLKIHVANAHQDDDKDEKNLTCSECGKEFASRNILTNHLIASHGVEETLSYQKSGRPVKTFECHLCDKKVPGLGAFHQHYAEDHPEEKRYTCKICQRHFDRIGHCIRHQRKHTGERPFTCDECGRKYRDEISMNYHKRCCHPTGPREEHPCETCGKVFAAKVLLENHKHTHSEALVFCTMCGTGFKSGPGFSRHNKRFHGGEASHTDPINGADPEVLKSMGIDYDPNRRKCHICWEPILANGNFHIQKHFDEHHPEHTAGPLTCQCGKSFEKYSRVQSHAMRHSEHEKSFQCDQCPRSFYSNHELKLHRTKGHIPREQRESYVCDICGLGLASTKGLSDHKRKHEENPQRWVCETCGKDYAEKRGLQHHVKSEHLKVQPFKCEEPGCGMAFTGKGDLKKHSRKHTGIKPYPCPHCDKRFPYNSGLSRHVREVHEKKERVEVTKKRGSTSGAIKEESSDGSYQQTGSLVQQSMLVGHLQL